MRSRRWIAGGLAALLGASPCLAAPSISSGTKDGGEAPMVEVVDIPTAEILDPGTYSLAFRFYNEGGVMSRFVIGPLKRVNLGISFDAQHLIGSGEPHLITPDVYFKVRAFDGNDYLPALALGYNNQGYLYQQSTKDFLNPAQDIYAVMSHEIFIPNLELHAGLNVNNLDNGGTLYGFFGATLKLTQAFALLPEYDNIRNGPTNRFNMGGRYYITPFFNVDLAARNIGRDGARGAERIVRLNYVGNFSF